MDKTTFFDISYKENIICRILTSEEEKPISICGQWHNTI